MSTKQSEEPKAAPPEPNPVKPAKSAASGPQGHAVKITATGFEPARLDIKAGDSVCWTNADSGKHSVKFLAAPDELPACSGGIRQGGTFEQAFKDAGAYEYCCESNPAMRGAVVVA